MVKDTRSFRYLPGNRRLASYARSIRGPCFSCVTYDAVNGKYSGEGDPPNDQLAPTSSDVDKFKGRLAGFVSQDGVEAIGRSSSNFEACG
jgi:hypothetical protein